MSHVPNFYCVGNASNHFSYIRYRLFHIVLKYLSLLDNEVKTEIHPILQVSMGGDNSDANLAPLCKGCHLYTTRVVRTKDIGSMYSLISKGVLAKETLDYFDLDPYHKALKIAKSYQHSQDLVPLNWI